MKIADLLKARRNEILAIAERHGASNVRVFGSVARGEAGPDSDVDFLVDLEQGRTLLDHGQLQVDLPLAFRRRYGKVIQKSPGLESSACVMCSSTGTSRSTWMRYGQWSALRDDHPEVPWLRVIGMRNVLVPGYFAIDLQAVSVTVERRVPEALGLDERS